ncbi:MAG: hypothetical protein GF403_10005 [Candidatus Coatesbacteria bacterium]|nr:hypothetical protein [Candidatus Coatesbacteria bacterium]
MKKGARTALFIIALVLGILGWTAAIIFIAASGAISAMLAVIGLPFAFFLGILLGGGLGRRRNKG